MKQIIKSFSGCILAVSLTACGANITAEDHGQNAGMQQNSYQNNNRYDNTERQMSVSSIDSKNENVTTNNNLRNLPSKVSNGAQITAKGNASPQLLTPKDHVLMLVDHQPQMAFATKSHSMVEVRNNTAGLAKSAKLFGVPTILTTVAAETFSGRIFPEIQQVFSDKKPIDRTTMNAWEDQRVVNEVKKSGKKKVVIAGLWTEVCVVDPVLSALAEGYTVYFVADASGGVSQEAHDMAVQRMTQAGAIPLTWLQYLLEMQRDWANQETYNAVLDIAKDHGGSYGLGVIYAGEMFGAKEGGK